MKDSSHTPMKRFVAGLLSLSLLLPLTLARAEGPATNETTVTTGGVPEKDEVRVVEAQDTGGAKRVRFEFCKKNESCRAIGREAGYTQNELTAMSNWSKAYEKQQFWRGFWVKMSYGIIDVAAFFVGMKLHLTMAQHMKMNLALLGVSLVGFAHGGMIWHKGSKMKDAAGRVEDKQQGSNPWFSSQASLAEQMDEYFAEAIQHIQAEEPAGNGATASPVTPPSNEPTPEPSLEPAVSPSAEPQLLGSAA